MQLTESEQRKLQCMIIEDLAANYVYVNTLLWTLLGIGEQELPPLRELDYNLESIEQYIQDVRLLEILLDKNGISEQELLNLNYNSSLFVDRREIIKDIKVKIKSVITRSEEKQILYITGERGVGKTWLLRHLHHTITAELEQTDSPIFIYIDFDQEHDVASTDRNQVYTKRQSTRKLRKILLEIFMKLRQTYTPNYLDNQLSQLGNDDAMLIHNVLRKMYNPHHFSEEKVSKFISDISGNNKTLLIRKLLDQIYDLNHRPGTKIPGLSFWLGEKLQQTEQPVVWLLDNLAEVSGDFRDLLENYFLNRLTENENQVIIMTGRGKMPRFIAPNLNILHKEISLEPFKKTAEETEDDGLKELFKKLTHEGQYQNLGEAGIGRIDDIYRVSGGNPRTALLLAKHLANGQDLATSAETTINDLLSFIADHKERNGFTNT